jgi:hypothetical protein
MRALVFSLLALVVSACSPAKPCSADSCSGCCTSQGRCVTGDSSDHHRLQRSHADGHGLVELEHRSDSPQSLLHHVYRTQWSAKLHLLKLAFGVGRPAWD